MRFAVINERRGEGDPVRDDSVDALLVEDAWDDFGYRTMFTLRLRSSGGWTDVGTVKIGHVSMDSDEQNRVPLPERFSRLDASYFSVGQDESYYNTLREIAGPVRVEVLEALRDIAFDDHAFGIALDHDVTRTSLLRFVKMSTVRGQLQRIARGGVRQVSFDIAYEPPLPPETEPVRFRFQVEPGSHPASNVHALTGRNGVGKSYVLSHLARAVAAAEPQPRVLGQVIEYDREGRSFANLVTVSFSAFDDDFPLVEGDEMFVASYVGLRVQGSRSPRFKTPDGLRKDFAQGMKACLTRERSALWIKALRILDYPGSGLLQEGWLENFENTVSVRSRETKARRLFRRLSAGHRIVLLTMTRLIEHVSERTLVIIDEPETHLHPPLLAAFMRALSELLSDRNGLAIVATHSPVVLQEIPAYCVWKLWRYGDQLGAAQPRIETYGENVGVLTHEVFGLELTEAGFLHELRRLVEAGYAYDDVLGHFRGRLGGEAQLVLSALIGHRDEVEEQI
ncbi:AAA family ATPase [Streptomyces sp. H39-C1]|uniref:AAA family ATPase n=1 Tax=Streptomyces sp. H39-C1 TaxID=3004355 RepID=UPI0022B05302|nr:AAA family ATPase [Streptomyces sp. H39-C1]MCZ4101321.1 AAA family ATPase [Streptomyces sp. H39-C1]